MNQKQRDYLIKRLEKIKNEKIVSFKINDPDPEPFIKMLNVARIAPIIEKMNKKFGDITNRRESGHWDYSKKGSPHIAGTKIIDLNIPSFVETKDDEYYTNLDKVQEKYKEHCKKHYQQVIYRHNSIEKKYIEMCDQIIFSEDYTEAARLIREFLKF